MQWEYVRVEALIFNKSVRIFDVGMMRVFWYPEDGMKIVKLMEYGLWMNMWGLDDAGIEALIDKYNLIELYYDVIPT